MFEGWKQAAAELTCPMFDGPPSPDQIYQGCLGDCVKLSIAGAIAAISPSVISERLYQAGKFVVFSPYNQKTGRDAIYVMDKKLPWYREGKRPFRPGARTATAWWPAMLEKGLALASYHSIRPPRQASRTAPPASLRALPGYDSLNYATPPESAAEIMTQLTAAPATILTPEEIRAMPTAKLHRPLTMACAKKQPVVSVFYAIPQAALDIADRYAAVDYHAYWLDDYYPASKMVFLKNPWHRLDTTIPLADYQKLHPTLIIGAPLAADHTGN